MFLREDYHKVPSWSITEFTEDFSDIVQEETCLAGMTTVRRAVELSTTG